MRNQFYLSSRCSEIAGQGEVPSASGPSGRGSENIGDGKVAVSDKRRPTNVLGAADASYLGSAMSRCDPIGSVISAEREGGMEEDPVQRLDVLQRDCLQGFLGANPQYKEEHYTWATYSPEEARGFLRAIDSGVFELLSDGRCRPVRLRASYCYPLIGAAVKDPPDLAWWPEWLTHAAIAAALHLDYGYREEDIALDVDALDALVYSDDNRPLIGVEAKKSVIELERMLGEMRSLAGQDFSVQCLPAGVKRTNAWKKVRALVLLRPPYFVAAAPGDIRAFDVVYTSASEAPELVPLDAIPRHQPGTS